MLMRSSIHKNIFFSVFAVLSFMIGAVFMGLFSAHAASSTCYDITGVVATDFGLISFDHIDGGPDFAHEACVEDEGPTPGDGPFTVKGWAFSNEFGWVSMYCADEN